MGKVFSLYSNPGAPRNAALWPRIYGDTEAKKTAGLIIAILQQNPVHSGSVPYVLIRIGQRMRTGTGAGHLLPTNAPFSRMFPPAFRNAGVAAFPEFARPAAWPTCGQVGARTMQQKRQSD